MSETIMIDLGNVQRTLLLPLWGRAVETQKRYLILIDKTASEIPKWNNKIVVVKEYPKFRNMLKELKLQNKIVALI